MAPKGRRGTKRSRSAPARQRRLLEAVALAKEWLGCDATMRMVVEGERARDQGGRPEFYLAPMAPLDGKPEDLPALRNWIAEALRPGARRPWPRFLPLRWRDHYSALVVTRAPGEEGGTGPPATLFDPHEGSAERWYEPPPPAADLLGPHVEVARPDLRGRGASQGEAADTFCAVWTCMYFADRWRPGQRLRDVYAFLQRQVRRCGRDFVRWAEDEQGLASTEARALYDVLTDSDVGAYRAAFANVAEVA